MATPPRPTTRRSALAASIAVLALAGCAASGPGPVEDGSYRYLMGVQDGATAADTTLEIRADTFTLTTPDGTTEATMGAETDEEYQVCVGDGQGTLRVIDSPITVGDATLTSPAIAGPCRDGATPKRVTVYDLDSSADTLPPFSRWVEFCDADDSDCPTG